MRADPIGQLGGYNLFLYTENNSINSIDPYGLKEICGIVKQLDEVVEQIIAVDKMIEATKAEIDVAEYILSNQSSKTMLTFIGQGTSILCDIFDHKEMLLLEHLPKLRKEKARLEDEYQRLLKDLLEAMSESEFCGCQ